MKNQRLEDRRQLHRYPHIMDAQGKLLGYLADISLHGMLMIAHHAIEPGDIQKFWIHLPKHLPFHQPIFPITVEIRWFRPYVHQDHLFVIGCQFPDLPVADQKLIQEIQSLLGFDPDFHPTRYVKPLDEA
ncbi:PilZ domain-containing protein [Candidatus Venteria ishoeyi]|uniref:PilZ domain-containing protein n=1 Tax=Candidatus Venteria ishoeyi TaxID=1899563 RepID=UPI0025A545F5|nr:PilZ domain-containing protein [Candidatus Venteria ishoeyi]MDM8546644.1 PilZ domain-containing protein [Candidatus Venteria ishoeyi]